MTSLFSVKGLALVAALNAFALFQGAAHALQTVDSFDGKTHFVKISQKEITRITVEGGRIRDVVYARDELDLQKDEVAGQIFFSPLVPKAINIFVSTASGQTHGFILQPSDIPLEQIVIREQKRDSAGVAGGQQGTVINNASTFGKEVRMKRLERGDVEGQVKRMVYALAKAESMPSCELKLSRQTVALYQGTYFERQLRLDCPQHTAEAFNLTNNSREPLRLVEQHLHTRGVLAVSIENTDLNPGDATRVFVVREGGRQ